jgi:hypothetical protein
LMRNTSLELRYLGTRATQLPVQARINTISAFTAGLQPLPTFLGPSQVPATILGGSRLADFENFSPFIHPEFSTMTAFPTIGGSIYHAGSADFNRRFARGLMLRANYTWAHNIDDATNELFSSVVNPRRPFDWMNLRLDRGRSTLDIRHKFAMSWIYEFPNVDTDNGILRTLLGGWQWNGTYLAQSGQPVSILANADANANGDAAGDRATESIGWGRRSTMSAWEEQAEQRVSPRLTQVASGAAPMWQATSRRIPTRDLCKQSSVPFPRLDATASEARESISGTWDYSRTRS